jgi:purine-nucleoside phosphorylase
MLGFTGLWNGRSVSVQGTGMGMPSISIYVHELLDEYGVRTLIRVGTCGALVPGLEIGDLVLAQAAGTDSAMIRGRFSGADFPPVADYGLLSKAVTQAERLGIPVRIGTVLSSDTFYSPEPARSQVWVRHGVLAIEMETAALYAESALFGAGALSILTVSDSIVSGASASAEQRETGFGKMIELALSLA